jgi:hypothetical protein
MQDEGNAGEGGGQLRLVPSRSEEIAWAAGLFEGEGSWNAYYRNGPRSKMNVSARLAMSDEDVVKRFAAVVGFGTMRARSVSMAHYKPMTEWYTQRRANVRALIVMFMPYLGDRRRVRAQEILDLGESHPLNERTHCPQGHAYEGDNLMLEPIERAGRRYFARRCRICRTEQSRLRAQARRAREKLGS